MTTITTQRLVMRPLREDDAERIFPYVSDPEISRFMSWLPHQSLDDTRGFIADVARRMADGATIAWLVSERASGEVCGLVSLIAIVRTHRALRYDKAELAYWLGSAFRGRGYATEACNAALSYAFETMELNKVTVAHAAENQNSRNLIERLGFRRVGVERRHFLKEGRWIDHVPYELLRSDWRPGSEGGVSTLERTRSAMRDGFQYNVGLAYAAIADRLPERAALRLPHGNDVTHRDLNALANRIAAVFSDRGLRRRNVIGIVHTKTAHCYAAMLASLKLGAAYVNLDDQNPPQRLRHILQTAQPDAIFAEAVPEPVRDAVAGTNTMVLEMCDPQVAGAIMAASPQEPPLSHSAIGSDPAYIMYTSGSTGVPKGAMMTHANVLNFGAWAGDSFDIGPQDVLTNVNPMYFDNSVFDFYGGLLNGAAIAPVTRETLADGAALLGQVESAGCTIWFSVPSLLIYLGAMKLLTPERLATVRTFVFGGEGYPKPELRKLHSTYGSRSRLVNVYGPTECTCICSAWDVRARDLEDPDGLVTLGPVSENFSMLVLRDETPVAPGEVGELCLLGPQVGLGYVNDPIRTDQSFAPNPHNARWVERMYRTGDLVRLGADGRMLDFVGRKDNQIKHMGYRIELEEIEAALSRVYGVVQCAAFQKTGRRGMKTIVAYVASDRNPSEDDLRAGLEELLPPYMIPQRFYVRGSLPKNANGKIDRAALAAEELS